MEDFASLSSKTVPELLQLVESRRLAAPSAKLSKRKLIEFILANSRVTSDYFERCMAAKFDDVKQYAIQARHHPGNKSQKELCSDLTWLVEGNPDEYPETDCDRWIKNKAVNPKTLRHISPTGKVYKQLAADCTPKVDVSEALDGPLYYGTFESNRDMLLYHYLDLFNLVVFDKKLTGRLRIEWHPGFGKGDAIAVTISTGYSRVVKIVLSEAMITSKERLRDALIHELCHAAVVVIDRINNPTGHGPEWLRWASIANQALPGLPKIVAKVDWKFYYPGKLTTSVYLLSGKLSSSTVLDFCQKNGFPPHKACLVFPGNTSHHSDSVTLYSKKTGSGLAMLAESLHGYGVATLSLPTVGVPLGTVSNVSIDAVADLWAAMGFGLNLLVPVRRFSGRYFSRPINGTDLEPSFWGAANPQPNPELATFYLENIELLLNFNSSRFAGAFKVPLNIGVENKSNSTNPWFANELQTGRRS